MPQNNPELYTPSGAMTSLASGTSPGLRGRQIDAAIEQALNGKVPVDSIPVPVEQRMNPNAERNTALLRAFEAQQQNKAAASFAAAREAQQRKIQEQMQRDQRIRQVLNPDTRQNREALENMLRGTKTLGIRG